MDQSIKTIIEKWRIPCFFHFTSGRNAGSIKSHGGLYALAEHEDRGIKCLGYLSDEMSRSYDRKYCLDQYVHLSFVEDHTMVPHAIERSEDGRILMLRICPEVLILPGVRFTPEVAMQRKGSTYPISEMEKWLDLNVIYGDGRRTTNNPYWTLGKARRAEVLVPNHVPLSLISDYCWKE